MVFKGGYFKSHIITGRYFMATIDLYKGLDIMVLGVPNAFIQTKIPPNKDGEEWVIIRITGVLVDMLVELDSETYRKHVVFQNGKKLIYIVGLR